MRRYAPDVEVGANVSSGDHLGEVGNTGYGADPGHHDEFPAHLHVGIQEPDGSWSNPYPIIKDLYKASVKDL
jgi:murein DD-endopeptidase MepM/ murein hydrolase activator NlpD